MLAAVRRYLGWGLWVIYVVWTLFDHLKDSDTWLDYFLPIASGVGLYTAALLAVRFPRVSLTLTVMLGTFIAGAIIFKLAEHWRFFLREWPVTLIILYLPLMGLFWLAYNRLAAKPK